MKILITGVAGFIGMHCAKKLLDRGDIVIGVDNLNDYYDVSLKRARLSQIKPNINFYFHKVDISNSNIMEEIFGDEKPDCVIHLAAQAGVRYSINSPQEYIKSNLKGFLNILESCRHNQINHLVYASSSSVYGASKRMPFYEKLDTSHALSFYAATKKANEVMAHSYSHLFDIPTTGLRFFTAYGPWGRPDMALFTFTKAMLEGNHIDVFNNGEMVRDFTYIDDIVEGIILTLDKPATSNHECDTTNLDAAASDAPYRIFNIGNGEPIPLMEYISALENALGLTAKKNFLPLQPGDVPATFADTTELRKWIEFSPNTPVQTGVKMFTEWYLNFYCT